MVELASPVSAGEKGPVKRWVLSNLTDPIENTIALACGIACISASLVQQLVTMRMSTIDSCSLEGIENDTLALGYIFLVSCYRTGCVATFASNFYLIRSRIPARVAAVLFAGAHHTATWNVGTSALFRVIHQFSAPVM